MTVFVAAPVDLNDMLTVTAGGCANFNGFSVFRQLEAKTRKQNLGS